MAVVTVMHVENGLYGRAWRSETVKKKSFEKPNIGDIVEIKEVSNYDRYWNRHGPVAVRVLKPDLIWGGIDPDIFTAKPVDDTSESEIWDRKTVWNYNISEISRVIKKRSPPKRKGKMIGEYSFQR
jgi:hypothetical protein